MTNKNWIEYEWTAADIADHIARSKLESGDLFIKKTLFVDLKTLLEQLANLEVFIRKNLSYPLTLVCSSVSRGFWKVYKSPTSPITIAVVVNC